MGETEIRYGRLVQWLDSTTNHLLEGRIIGMNKNHNNDIGIIILMTEEQKHKYHFVFPAIILPKTKVTPIE